MSHFKQGGKQISEWGIFVSWLLSAHLGGYNSRISSADVMRINKHYLSLYMTEFS